jgi:addiction module RelE/StbE family toxin
MTNKKFKIKFTPKASDDLNQIYDYISKELFAKKSANKLFDKIEKSIMNLEYFPYSCSLVLDESLRTKGYRKLIIDNYIVFYLINNTKKEVIIIRILYGAQNYKDLF